MIKAKKGDNNIAFIDTVIKSSEIKGGKGKELITIEEGTKLIGKNSFNLGNNEDSVYIDGSAKSLTIDSGNDKDKDMIVIDSYDLIKKNLTIKNFGKADRLVIEGDVFKYKSLSDKKTINTLRELGIVVDTIGAD